MKVYVVLVEGEVEFASTSRETAKGYKNDITEDLVEKQLEEWGREDPSEKNNMEALYQLGYDGVLPEIVKVDIPNQAENGTIELSDGLEIEISDILDKMDDDDIECD